MITYLKRFASFLLFATLAQTSVASTPQFLGFAGVYQGTLKLTIAGGTSITGPATIVVKTPKSGATASLTVSGKVISGGITYPASGVLNFKKSQVFTISDVTFNLPSKTIPAIGSFQGRPILNFNAPFNVMGSVGKVAGSARFRATKAKDFLTLTSVVSTSAPIYTYSFSVSKKAKK